MTRTNAQAALQAAATVYEGARGHTDLGSVRAMAQNFKDWLDAQDKADKRATAKATEDVLAEHFPGLAAAMRPEPTVSHHISCTSRARGLPCNCTPVPYTKDLPHYLAENHNADPVCGGCGWEPTELAASLGWSRDDARHAVRGHIKEAKP